MPEFKPGDRVVYYPKNEPGTVTSVSDKWVFVHFDGSEFPRGVACRAVDLDPVK